VINTNLPSILHRFQVGMWRKHGQTDWRTDGQSPSS